MRLGSVHFSHLNDDQLEDVYGAARGLGRDVRASGCYGLSNLLKAFATECVLELNRREMQAKGYDQLRIGDSEERQVIPGGAGDAA